MCKWIVPLTLLLISGLQAQTFYAPIEYEYRAGGTIYFYGGDNPLVHGFAAEPHANGVAWGRQGGFAYSSADIRTSREVDTERVRVFSDAWRSGLSDATLAGFTVADARNEANASVPRYFCKSDIVRQARIDSDGRSVVPARAGNVIIRKSSGERVVPPPARPLLIIPRDSLPAPQAENLQVLVD